MSSAESEDDKAKLQIKGPIDSGSCCLSREEVRRRDENHGLFALILWPQGQQKKEKKKKKKINLEKENMFVCISVGAVSGQYNHLRACLQGCIFLVKMEENKGKGMGAPPRIEEVWV